MKYILILSCIFYLLTSCNSQSDDIYFKLTLTDQANPIGLLPECIEVGSDGKLVILTNRFNEGKEIYQRTYFIELNKHQLDSIKILMAYLPKIGNIQNYDTSFHYKIKLDKVENKQRTSHIYMASTSDINTSKLINYCKSLPDQNHRYKVKHSYYFNTDEICLKLNPNEKQLQTY